MEHRHQLSPEKAQISEVVSMMMEQSSGPIGGLHAHIQSYLRLHPDELEPKHDLGNITDQIINFVKNTPSAKVLGKFLENVIEILEDDEFWNQIESMLPANMYIEKGRERQRLKFLSYQSLLKEVESE